MIRKRYVALAIGSIMVSFMSTAYAQKTYQLTGSVQKIEGNDLSVERNGELFDFRLDKSHLSSMDKLHVGDQVTVSYTLDLKKIELQKGPPKQMPGQVDPFQHIIKDDRIFHEAQRQNEPSVSGSSQPDHS